MFYDNRWFKIIRAQGYQSHHILPKEIADTSKDYTNNPTYDNARKLIQESGFDIRSLKNHIFLPDGKAGTEGHETRTIHRGRHPGYTDAIAERLSELYEQSQKEEWSKEQTLEAVKTFVRGIKQKLRKGEITLNNAVDYSRKGEERRQQAQLKQFDDSLHSTGLGKSYQSSNPEYEMPASLQGGKKGPGGVMVRHGHGIEGIKNTVEHVLTHQYHFAIACEGDQMPFRDDELQQIIRELAIGIYCHDAVPFFSLHFNADGTQYPVIHPIYERTLVGRVISMLDYMMKGYLNGAIFTEDKIDEWEKIRDRDVDRLNSQLVDLYDYIYDHRDELGDMDYTSLQDMMGMVEIEQYITEGKKPDSTLTSETLFRTSFRIIGTQDGMQKTGNTIIIGNDFEVEYDIETTPDYDNHLRESQEKTGAFPNEWVKLNELYRHIANDVKEKMPKLPLCREYFNMLHIINGVSHFLLTQKEMGQVPILKKVAHARTTGSPSLFPPIPIQKPVNSPVCMSMNTLFGLLSQNDKRQLEAHIIKCAHSGILTILPSLENTMLQHVMTYIENQLPKSHSKLAALKQRFLLNGLQSDRIPQIIRQLLEKLGSCLKEIYQASNFDQFKKAIQTLETNRQTLESQRQEILRSIDRNESSELNKLNQLKQERLNEINNYQAPYGYRIDYSKLYDAKQELEIKFSKIRIDLKEKVQESRQNVNKEVNQKIDQIKIEITDIKIKQKKAEDTLKKLKTTPFDVPEFQPTLNEMSIHVSIPLIRSQVVTAHEYDTSVRDQKRVILGGCGLNVQTQHPVSSIQSSMLDQSMSCKQHHAPSEVFESCSVGQQRYAVFNIKIAPTRLFDPNYTWLNDVWSDAVLDTKSRLLFLEALEKNQKKDIHSIVSKLDLSGRDTAGKTPLYYAIQTGDIDYVKALVTAGARWTNADANGMTDYHWAIISGYIHIIQYFDQQKTKENHWNQANRQGHRAISFAVQYNHQDVLHYLLKKGVDVNYRHTNGLTPLSVAIMRQYEECALALIQHPTSDLSLQLEDHSTMLHLACESNQPSIIAALARARNQNRPIGENIEKRNGYTALHILAEEGHATIINAHKDIFNDSMSIATVTGFLPIHLAVRRGHIDVLDLCLKWKKDTLNQPTLYGNTPLMEAIKHGQEIVAMWLIHKGALTDIKNNENETAFSLALSLGLWDVCDVLIEKDKQCLEMSDHQEWTVTHYIARSGHWYRLKAWEDTHPIIKANRQKTNKQGDTPYDIAMRYGHFGIATILNPSILGDMTLEHGRCAAKYGDVSMVLWYLKNKNSKDIINTLMRDAARHGQIKIMEAIMHQRWNDTPMEDVTLLEHNGFHVAYDAIMGRQLDVLKWLLYKQGFDLESKINPKGMTCIEVAAQLGDLSLVTYFDSQGASIHTEELWGTINNHPKIMNYLLTLDSEPIQDDIVTTIIRRGHTNVMHVWLENGRIQKKPSFIVTAIQAHQAHMLQILVDYGVPIQSLHHPKTALMYAIETKNPVMVQQVLSYNVPLILQDSNKKTLFDYANESHQTHIIETIQFVLGEKNKASSYGKEYLSWLEQQEKKDRINKLFGSQKSSDMYHAVSQLFQSFSQEYPTVNPNQHIVSNLNGKQVALLPWQWACVYGQGQILKHIYPQNMTHSFTGEPPIHYLAHINDTHVVDTIQKKYNIDCHETDTKGNTALHTAIQKKSVQLLPYLLSKGIQVNQSNHDGISPMVIAIKMQDTTMVNILLNADQVSGEDTQRIHITPILMAVAQNNIPLLDQLIRMGEDPNIACGADGITALMVAVEYNQYDTALRLISAGADISKPNYHGHTVAHYAAQKGHIQMIPLLKQVSQTPTDTGYYPIHYAALFGHDDYMAYGINTDMFHLNTKTKVMDYENTQHINQKNEFHLAALNGSLKVINLLMSKQVDYEACDSNGKNAFIYAAESGRVELMKRLSSTNLFSNDAAQQAMIQAAIRNHVNIIQFIESKGIDFFDMPDSGKNGVLHYTSAQGSVRSTQYLLQSDSLFSEENSEGLLPIHIAIKNGNISNIGTLIDHDPLLLEHQDRDGNTLLHHAVQSKKYVALLYLIYYGARTNTTNNIQFTPQKLAAYIGYKKGEELLGIMEENDHESSPLYRAIMASHDDAFRLCIKRQDDVNAININGNTALHGAVQMRHHHIVQEIMKHHPILHLNQDNNSALDMAYDIKNTYPKIWDSIQTYYKPSTQLIVAIQSKNTALIDDLWNYSNTELAIDSVGEGSPLHYAIHYGYHDMVYRIYHRISPKGESIYHTAINRHNTNELVYLLKKIKNKEDALILNNQGYTALGWAIHEKKVDVVQLFLDYSLDTSHMKYQCRNEVNRLKEFKKLIEPLSPIKAMLSPHIKLLDMTCSLPYSDTFRELSQHIEILCPVMPILNRYKNSLNDIYKEWVSLNQSVARTLANVDSSKLKRFNKKIADFNQSLPKNTDQNTSLVIEVIRHYMSKLNHSFYDVQPNRSSRLNDSMSSLNSVHDVDYSDISQKTRPLHQKLKDRINQKHNQPVGETIKNFIVYGLTCSCVDIENKRYKTWLTSTKQRIELTQPDTIFGVAIWHHIYGAIDQTAKS